MKTRTTQRLLPGALFAATLAAGMMMKSSSAAANSGNGHLFTTNEEPKEKVKPSKNAKKDKLKLLTFHKTSSVRVYMDYGKHHIHVIAGKNEEKDIDFFVFTLDGTLVQNYKIKSKEHKKIVGLPKGTYVYRVFCGDEEEVSGNLVIK